MTTHLVGSFPTASVRLLSLPTFSGSCEFRAEPVPHGPPGREQAAFACQKGAPAKSCEDCEMCPRFRGWRKDVDTQELLVQCTWSARDPVSARMTAAAALICVSPQTPCVDAAALARSHGVHHLPVLSEGKLLGLVCLCDLTPLPRDELVSRRMSTEILAVEHRTCIAEAAAAMSLFKVGCLPVVADGLLTGLITRGDLRRVGVPARLLAVVCCSRCKSEHGVKTTPRAPGAALCVDCLERARQEFAQLDLPEAD